MLLYVYCVLRCGLQERRGVTALEYGLIVALVSLAVVTESSRARPDSNLRVTSLRDDRSHAQCNADLIIQAWRAFPTMMLRRETFPWFIHPRSQLLPTSSEENVVALPRAISSCMGISQMFASRTPETKPFLWRTIEAEYRQLVKDVRPSQLSLSPCSCAADTYPPSLDPYHVQI